MKSSTLFPAPFEDDPDESGDRDGGQDKHPGEGNADAEGGEYILHFRDPMGRFTDPPIRK